MNLSNKLRKKKISWRDHLNAFFNNVIYDEPGDPPMLSNFERSQDRYRFSICVYCWKLQKIPLFNTTVMLMVLANSIVLATDKYPEPQNDVINKSNTGFIIFFTFELMIKLIGLRFEEW